ncbi:APA family basic amino acid/polyamine antiporter [Pontibacter aydingkolensis]|uniref:Amino acid permease n=1 Tax=Pontibacter aydingkolensis TaxID=1911536 RepID=A0ABS7CXM3_9BACT|nr:amino acid permease [Pontibacter aydingkolensis]MBW7468618.1 amino acid permease [Pontibacter aydingkolensis]
MANNIFATKSVDKLIKESESGKHGLKRTLTASHLTMLGVGAIIGAGIFVLTGTAAANAAGPAIVISFLIAGLGCLFAGLCYAEFASMIPVAGSAYTYGYATLGEFIAWIIGWDLVLEYLFGAATVAVGWSGNFVSLLKSLGITIPTAIASAPLAYNGASFEATGTIINLPAIILILVMTALLVVGIQESAKFNNIIVVVKVAIVLLVIGFGFQYVNSANWEPFIPAKEILSDGSSRYGWQGVVAGAAIVFFSYIGFDAVSTAAQEAKNPQRDMPIGMLASLGVCTLLYVLMSLVLTGIVPYESLNVPDPVLLALQVAGPGLKWLYFLTGVGAVAGLASVVLVMLMAQPRIFYSMSRDGLLPGFFGKVHPKYNTPYVPTIITGVVAAIIAGIFPIGLLGELVSIGTLLAFVIVCAGIIVLRRTNPDLKRPFKTPFVPLVPILGILICGYMMVNLGFDTWIRLIAWMGIGVVIYFLYGRKHSKLRKPSEAPSPAKELVS